MVGSHSKREVTAYEKAAESKEESALALELRCEEARSAAVDLDSAKAEYNKLAVVSITPGRLLAIYGEVLVQIISKSKFIEMGSSLALTCGTFCCVTQLFLWHSGKKPSHYHIQPSPWTQLFPFS